MGKSISINANEHITTYVEDIDKEILAEMEKCPLKKGVPLFSEDVWKEKSFSEKMKVIESHRIQHRIQMKRNKLKTQRKKHKK